MSNPTHSTPRPVPDFYTDRLFPGVFLDSGQVRVLAAQLVAAADVLDRVGTPLGKKATR